jgi:hypothetical protein
MKTTPDEIIYAFRLCENCGLITITEEDDPVTICANCAAWDEKQKAKEEDIPW